MANIKSQIKRNKTNEKRAARNKAVRTALKTSTKKALNWPAIGVPATGINRDGLKPDREQRTARRLIFRRNLSVMRFGSPNGCVPAHLPC